MTPPLPKPALRQLGQYQLLELIGSGGMGAVFRALHSRLKKIVALKVLPAAYVQDEEAVARFCREMEAIGRLEHPHLVRATDAGEADGVHFLVMEYLAGEDLGRLVRRVGRLSVADACELARQAAVGLTCVHQHGMVHRDIKPSNLLLTSAGQVKILDWGLAKTGTETAEVAELTGTGQALGTADYMAPEQWRDSRHVEIRADIYSLGCTLYMLLTGEPPFSGPGRASREQKMQAHLVDAPVALSQRRADLPEALSELVGRMMAKSPADRLAEPEEVARTLMPFAHGADLAKLMPPGSSTSDLKSPRGDIAGRAEDVRPQPAALKPDNARRPNRWFMAVALLLVVSTVVAIIWWTNPDGEGDNGIPRIAEQTLEPGKWHNLFPLFKPKPLVWPKSVRDASRWSLDLQREELYCNCEDVGLLGLTALGPADFSFSIVVRQNPWVGGAGIFFGHQPKAYKGRPGHQYQLIELRPFRKDKIDQAFAMWRSLVFRWVDDRGEPRYEKLHETAEPLSWPSSREQILELAVEKTGLVQVRWDGKELRHLTKPDFNAKMSPKDYQGEVGVYTFVAAATFRNARLLLERNEP